MSVFCPVSPKQLKTNSPQYLNIQEKVIKPLAKANLQNPQNPSFSCTNLTYIDIQFKAHITPAS